MKNFMGVVYEDAELATRLSNMDKEALITEAQKRGTALTGADFTAEKGAELSENELSEVAGGGGNFMKRAAVGIGNFNAGERHCTCKGAGGGVDN